MKKVILMARVSTEAQSYDEQCKDILNMAVKDGYTEDECLMIAYKESAIKLSDEERHGLTDMYNAIGILRNPLYVQGLTNQGIPKYLTRPTPHEIEVVYIWELSRLSRKKITLDMLQEYFVENQIQLKCNTPYFRLINARGELDTAAELMFSVYTTMASSEIRLKNERFRRTKIQMARNGICGNHNVCFGYRAENLRYAIDEDEAAIVRAIFNMYEKGLSERRIVTELKAQDVDRMRGQRIYSSRIHRILGNEGYTGKTTTERGLERIYPVIITQEQFQRCRDIASGNNLLNIYKGNYVYYAEGVIVCEKCGRPLTGVQATNTYWCANSRRKSTEGKTQNPCDCMDSVSINMIDSLAWHYASLLESRARSVKSAGKMKQMKEEIAALYKKIDKANAKLDNVRKAYGRSKEMYKLFEIDKEEYMADKGKFAEMERKLENEILNYRKSIKSLEQHIADTGLQKEKVESIREINDDGMRRDIVRKQIQKICCTAYRKGFSKKITMQFSNNTQKEFVYTFKNGRGRYGKIERICGNGNLRLVEFEYFNRVGNNRGAKKTFRKKTKGVTSRQPLCQKYETKIGKVDSVFEPRCK